MKHIFFNGWAGPVRTLVIGLFAYAMLILFLRISGKRTLSKMNAFDFIVTIALGSTLASILLTRDVTLVQGGVAFALLIGLQYIVTWSSVRTNWVRKLVTGEPSLLLFRGELLQSTMRQTRVTEEEVRSAIRAAGLASFDDAEAVVLETDASFSVSDQTPRGCRRQRDPEFVERESAVTDRPPPRLARLRLHFANADHPSPPVRAGARRHRNPLGAG